MPKRRILEKIKLTEISGVDKPCQEGALVTIMKRADDEVDTSALAARIKKVEEQANKAAGQAILREFDKVLADLNKFDPNQPRDAEGQWTLGGGSRTTRTRGSKRLQAGPTAKQFLRASILKLVGSTASGALTSAAYSTIGTGVLAAMSGTPLTIRGVVAGAAHAGMMGGATSAVFTTALIAIAGAQLINRALSEARAKRKTKLRKMAPQTLLEDLKGLSPEEVDIFIDVLLDGLSDEQAMQLAEKLGMDSKVEKAWSRQAREAAAEARRRKRQLKGQPKKRWLKAGALSLLGGGPISPIGAAIGATYLYRTRASRYAKALADAELALEKFNAAQLRDKIGRWTTGGGGSGGKGGKGKGGKGKQASVVSRLKALAQRLKPSAQTKAGLIVGGMTIAVAGLPVIVERLTNQLERRGAQAKVAGLLDGVDGILTEVESLLDAEDASRSGDQKYKDALQQQKLQQRGKALERALKDVSNKLAQEKRSAFTMIPGGKLDKILKRADEVLLKYA